MWPLVRKGNCLDCLFLERTHSISRNWCLFFFPHCHPSLFRGYSCQWQQYEPNKILDCVSRPWISLVDYIYLSAKDLKSSFHGTGKVHYGCRTTENCKAHKNWTIWNPSCIVVNWQDSLINALINTKSVTFMYETKAIYSWEEKKQWDSSTWEFSHLYSPIHLWEKGFPLLCNLSSHFISWFSDSANFLGGILKGL